MGGDPNAWHFHIVLLQCNVLSKWKWKKKILLELKPKVLAVYNIHISNNNKNTKKVDTLLNRILKALQGLFFDKCYGNDNMT